MANSPFVFNDTFEQLMNGVAVNVFDVLRTGVAVVDGEGILRYCNKSFLQMYCMPDDAIGKHIGDFFLVDKKSLSDDLASRKMAISLNQSTNNIYGILFRYPIYDIGGNFCGIAIESLPTDLHGERLGSLIESMRALEMKTYGCQTRNKREKPISTFEGMIGESPPMQNLRFLGQRFALSDEPVLINGESGTGKELVARALHHASPRASRPFVSVNCAALPPELLVSELFGYEGGAFTGGRAGGMKGKFEEANEGTIFLDEIGELPFSAQAKLLRVLENGEVQKLGHKGVLHSNFRLIGATNRDLAVMVRAGDFREDLYHRLSVFELTVPPLRDRGDDLFLLTRHYIEQYLDQDTLIRLDPELVKMFRHYTWPGNIRELKNTLIYMLYSLGANEHSLSRNHLPPRFLKSVECLNQESPGTRPEMRSDPLSAQQPSELQLLKTTLARLHYNKVSTARELGMSRSKLYRLINKYGLQV